MTLYDILETIKYTSLSHKLVNEYHEGDVYEEMNNGVHQYPTVHLTFDTAREEDDMLMANMVLFYIDRLESDNSNLNEIKSVGTTVLSEIIHKFIEENYANVKAINYTYFKEKFADDCAGVYATFEIETQSENGGVGLCDDNAFE